MNKMKKPCTYNLNGQLVEVKSLQSKQLKPVFCVSNTNIKKNEKVNHELSNKLKSMIEPSGKVLRKFNSKLHDIVEIQTGYINPGEIRHMFEKVKISEGVRLVDSEGYNRDFKPELTTYGNSGFKLSKTSYNKM